jgi:hypothetical protein
MSLYSKRPGDSDCYGGAEIIFPDLGLIACPPGFPKYVLGLVSAELAASVRRNTALTLELSA